MTQVITAPAPIAWLTRGGDVKAIAPREEPGITEAQHDWLVKLVVTRSFTPDMVLPKLSLLTKKDAGRMIDALKDLPVINPLPEVSSPLKVDPGRYALPAIIEGGKVRKFRVAESNAGRTYVKAIMPGGGERYLADRRLVTTILVEIAVAPLEASIAYGRATSRCGVCHKELSDPVSMAAGIGPKCVKRF